jgi:CO/xanthine dehydrogenase FAD-binding subunit
MDLNGVTDLLRPTARHDLPALRLGDAWLAGGTWLFSEPQPDITRLIDITELGWPPLVASDDGLTIAATCPVATLEAFEAPPQWRAGSLLVQCCHAFLASFKIWTMATVGGNLCLALPAGPMISLCVALEGRCVVWLPGGGERQLPAADLIVGPQRTALAPGELLRSIHLPAAALERRTAFRQVSLSNLGRSAALLIGTRADDGGFRLTVTAATRRPVVLAFPNVPTAGDLQARLTNEIPFELYYDDVHGAPEWRRHLTAELAEEIRVDLGR